MKSYGQFCPLAQAAQLLCERWTLLVVRELIAGSTRFSELQRGVPQMSPTLLSTRLKQLTRDGIVEHHGMGKQSSYRLTAAGEELRPVVELMGAWGHRWVRSNLKDQDLDAGLLMWDMHRSIDASVFPNRRVVVKFVFPDALNGAREWWLLSEHGEIDLCLQDPSHDIDVIVQCSLAVMTAVWTCQRQFDAAVRQGDIKVSGDPKLIKKLPDWIQASLLSRLGTVKELPELKWT
jgi:DNA-binding HxlR family transcriptional regulator